MSKTQYMAFVPKSKPVDDVNIKVRNRNTGRASVTKFLGAMIDAQLQWKCYNEYTCKNL